MTDRELLELAAKAAGYRLANTKPGYPLYAENGIGLWNPIADDGDALRLAVKLDLSSLMVFSYPGNQKRREFWSPNSGTDGGRSATTEAEYAADPLAATRRAIVRAAAELGRSMK